MACVRTIALDPGFHGARTHWIPGFIAFGLARRARTVMLMVSVWPESGFWSAVWSRIRYGRFAASGRVCHGVVMAWVELDGAVNVRDLGDMPTEDGQKTARGSLLRADNLQDLSAADVRKLVHDIGVTTVVDLRSSNELAAEGPAPLDAVAGVRHAHHPVLPEVGSTTDVIADALLARDRMDKFRYPGDPVCGHYLGYLAARLRRSRLYSRDVNSKPADLQRPRAETMAAFLEQMNARYGGVASWLTDHGLSAADLDALRVKLRAGA